MRLFVAFLISFGFGLSGMGPEIIILSTCISMFAGYIHFDSNSRDQLRMASFRGLVRGLAALFLYHFAFAFVFWGIGRIIAGLRPLLIEGPITWISLLPLFLIAWVICTIISQFSRGAMNDVNVLEYGPTADWRYDFRSAFVGTVIAGFICAAIITAVVGVVL